MSRLLVTQYQAEVEKIIRYGGSKKETSIRNAFERLLNDYCKPRNYLLIPELDFKTKFNTTVFPDGTVKDAIRLEHGWWESKDQYDKLDEEIEKKLEKGYPDENILFEDSQTAILIQHSREQLRVSMRDAEALDGLISTFVDYERPEVRDFRAAIVKFKEDVPHILEALRSIIAQQEESNPQFRERRNTFLKVCRESINPEIEIFDIHEMLIQHILTEDIFTNIFHESQFHRENNIARELSEIINTFFTGATRKNTLKSIEPYGLRRVDVGGVGANGDSPLQATLIPIDAPDPAKPIKRTTPKAKLKADKTEGKIILDTETTLEGVPAVAWDYKLGNRSALEWILDQYKEKTPKDPTIAKLFNTYKFADYKEHVIDLLQRVCTVSVRTMEIIQQMPDTVEHQGG